MHCRAVDMDVSDWVSPELLLLRFVARHIRQTADAMALQTPMQRGPRQVRNGRLQRVKAIVQWQQRVAAEGYDHRFILNAQNRGMRFLWAHLHIADPVPLAPLGHRLDVDPQFPAQRRVRSARLSGHCCAIPCQPVDRCMRARIACVSFRAFDECPAGQRYVALPCKTCPIGRPSDGHISIDHHTLGLNRGLRAPRACPIRRPEL